MKDLQKKITVIVAVFNGVKTLQHCIDSVANQTFKNVEFIIIDGGSNDGTVEIIKRNAAKISYWVSEPDKGIYDAWNKALKEVHGEWIMYLGSDDTLLPDALNKYVEYTKIHNNNSLYYISSKVNLVSGEKFIRTIGKQWRWGAFKRFMNVAHVGSIHSKHLYDDYGVYDTTYKICADYELLLRPKAKLRAGFLNHVTVSMSIGGASDSIAALEETKRAKILSGGRNKLVAEFECQFAKLRMTIRKKIWY